MRIILATILLCLVSTIAQASFDRHDQRGWAQTVSEVKVVKHHKVRKASRKSNATVRTSTHRERSSSTAQILPHPVGCPVRAFCGCGAALDVFGKHVRELWLAANWFKFPRAEPAPGMVAVRKHHVFVIREVIGAGMVMAYDANSGGHRTRIHLRSLAGYSVRNPHGARYANAE